MVISLQTVIPFYLAGTLPLKVSVTEQPTGSAAADFKVWGVNNVQNKYIRSNSFGRCAGSAAAFSQEAGRSDAAVQAFGSFVKTTTNSGVKQGAQRIAVACWLAIASFSRTATA